MKKVLFLIITFFYCFSLKAQLYEADALRFAQHNTYGTSRFMALGGAFSSVGADFSNLSYNPAGVGMYRNSIFQLTSAINFTNYNSLYLNQESEDYKTKVTFPSLGLIFSSNKPSKNSMFRSFSFGFGMNRLADYNFNETYQALISQPNSSITWSWVDEISSVNGSSNGAVSDEQFSFEAVDAYYTYLVNFDSSILDYNSPITDSVQQSRFSDVKGQKNEVVLSAGTNFLDKLYLGATLGIPILSYSRNTRTLEEDVNNANESFNSFELKQAYKTEGLGFNLKAGIIYKVNNVFRVSAALHTPELLSLKESWSTNISSSFDTISFYNESRDGFFEYKLRLPWRMNSGFSLFLNKRGFFSFDYEAVGYNSMRYNFGNNFKEVANQINSEIKRKYKVGHNFRAGLEIVINKFKLRAGYNYLNSAIRKEFAAGSYNFSSHQVSGGFGILWNKWALDFAYQHSFSKQFEQAYTRSSVSIPGIYKNVNRGSFSVSLAYRLK